MPDISQYTDYRKFLSDYYAEAKQRSPSFSYQVLAARAGIKSKGFLHNVIAGKRPLDRAGMLGLAQALKLDPAQTEYFENLLALAHARTHRERNHYYEKLLSIRASGTRAWAPQQVRRDQYEYYTKLHHSVVRSLIDLHGLRGDYAGLAKRVWPRITESQARKSVALLARLGLVRKGAGGAWQVTSKSIATAPEVADVNVLNFHQQSGEVALRALSEFPRNRRNFTATTLGISAATYERMCEEIQTLRTRLMRLAEEDRAADRVYQINFQFFPVSNTSAERGTR
jgi:uncharacterized protein (TIGR02147 family)